MLCLDFIDKCSICTYLTHIMNRLMSLLMVIYISVFHPLIFDHTFYISIDLKFD